ncbi:MAG: ABC transporter permease, partial [Candidatus Marinimicrobia bacterium]|nr:ABC transporter permease [Candidatus Neomarinimicrobiota bacterium]
IGQTVWHNLFGERNPLGENIRINNVNFQVRGVLQERGAAPGGGDMDNLVLIPLTTFSRRLFNMDHLTMAIVQLYEGADVDKAEEQITTLLRERHKIVPPALDDFRLSTPRESMQRMASVMGSFNTYLALIAGISLVVGGLLVMNIMLVSISERKKEIGIRRAVGARKRDIFYQFLIEAGIVTLLGGLIGIALSAVGSYVFFLLAGMPFYFSWQALMLSLFAAITVGLISGLQPALKAAALDPIQPLRE